MKLSKFQELWLKQKQQIADEAKPFLPPGETPQFIILSQTKLPNWLAPLPFSAIYGVKKRAVVVTDQHIYLLDMPLLSPTKVSGVIEKYPLEGANLKRGAMGCIQLGSTKVWPVGSRQIGREVEGALQSAGARD